MRFSEARDVQIQLPLSIQPTYRTSQSPRIMKSAVVSAVVQSAQWSCYRELVNRNEVRLPNTLTLMFSYYRIA